MAGIFFQGLRKYIRRTAILACLAYVCGSGPLGAQVYLPPVRDAPAAGGILGEVERDMAGLSRNAGRTLTEARQRLISELVRRNRADLERDPRGDAIVRGEVTAFSPTPGALAAAREAGFSVIREVSLERLNARIVVFRVPNGVSTRRALRRLQSLDREGAYDYNHLYLPVEAAPLVPQDESGAPDASIPAAPRVRVGLVDGGVAEEHPALRAATIHGYGCEGSPVPSAHGTAVASLLVGHAEDFRGAAPGGILYAADIYCGRITGGAADAFASALAWLARQDVAVINTSIVGPPNRILEGVVRLLVNRGHLIVAAVGNDGPAARPLYPAAYAGTVGVTGVNASRQVLREAGRGPHVDFAAPGTDMLAAGTQATYAKVHGTSFAAPLVAGLLAIALEHPDPRAARTSIANLAALAVDLGRPGRDEVYGEGLVAEGLRVAP
jgi:subtilisin family serine protease